MSERNEKLSFIQQMIALRWPMYLAAILSMSVIAQGVMVYHATSKEAPLPKSDYYEKAQQWDITQAQLSASKALGWRVDYSMPTGKQYIDGMARPVDVTVSDRDGKPVSGLKGKLIAVHPSESRLNTDGTLTELPHDPGHYRVLLPFQIGGLWDFNLDVTKGKQPFVNQSRFIIKTGREHK